MSTGRPDPQGAIGGALTSLRRHWRTALLVVVLITVASVVAALLSESRYRSTARVLVADRDLAGLVAGVSGNGSGGANVATEIQIAGLPSVVEQAKVTLGDTGSPAAEGAEVNLKVASAPGTTEESNVLEVNADSSDPEYSVRLATAVAERYVAFRRDLATREIRDARDDIAARVRELAADGNTGSRLYEDLRSRQQQLETLLILGSSRASLLEGGEPAKQIAPQPVRSGVLGLLLGIAAAAVIAITADRLRRRTSSNEEIAELLDLSILGLLPDPRRREGAPNLVVRAEPDGPGAEAFRSLRTNVRFALATRGERSVMITSAKPAEGKTFVAANLAIAAASSGEDVILIDADFRRPGLSRYLALPRQPGLSDVVAGDVSLDQALVNVPLTGYGAANGSLRFLPPGRAVPNPGEFIASEAVARELRRLTGAEADLVVVDTPPVLAVSDATALAQLVPATIAVVRADDAQRSMLTQIRELMANSAHKPIGAALTAAWGRRGPSSRAYSYEQTGSAEGLPDPDPSAAGDSNGRLIDPSKTDVRQ